MIHDITTTRGGKMPTDPATDLTWLADVIDRAAYTLRTGGRLTRRDCLAIARAALRCADGEVR